MTHDQTMQAVKAIAKSYWCHTCLERSVTAMSTFGPYALHRPRSCRLLIAAPEPSSPENDYFASDDYLYDIPHY